MLVCPSLNQHNHNIIILSLNRAGLVEICFIISINIFNTSHGGWLFGRYIASWVIIWLLLHILCK